MHWMSSSRDSEPFAYVRGVAVDLTVVLISLHILSTLIGVVFMVKGLGNLWASWMALILPKGVFELKLWQFISYPFYHNIVSEKIWFALDMLILWWFGREVERYLGKLSFAFLYFSLAIIPALVAFGGSQFFGAYPLAGSNDVHLGVFMAFVFLYPQSMFFGGIRAVWFAVALLAIYSLVAIARLDWIGLLVMWAAVGVAYMSLKIYFLGSLADRFHGWQVERQARKMERRRIQMKEAEEDFHQSVDPILEKISREGIDSLTKEERNRLEQARVRMLRKDKK